MRKFWTCCLWVLLTSACVAQEAEDFPLEQSRPAYQMAADIPDLDPPSSYGFEAPELSNAPGAITSMPRWYCPKSVVSRAQIASFLARTIEGMNASFEPYDGRFSDVSSASPHAQAIRYIADKGITDGCSEGVYCPDHGVTRGQMALFTVRMMHGRDYILPDPGSRFADVPADHLHAAAIEQLAVDGIDVSCGPGMFCPDAPVSRDEVASFLVGAKYRTQGAPAAPDIFADVGSFNPHRMAINVIARDGVTMGCDAPVAGYRLQGEPLTERQRDWMLYFAGRAIPRLTAAYGDIARAFTVASRVIWWGLKEGVFGFLDDPYRHATCDGDYINPFETCSGAWEVGLTAAIVPSDAAVNAAVQALYPQRTSSEMAMDLLEFGRALSTVFDAGEYPVYATERVQSDAALRRSWVTRDAAVGAYLMIDGIERDCVEGLAPERCFSIETESARDFAPNAERATEVQADLRRLLNELRPR